MTASILATVLGGMGYLSTLFSSRGLLTIRQTLFDTSQATLLQEHTQALSVRQAIAQSRKSRGFLGTILRRDPPLFKPTYNYGPDGNACRIFGTVNVKKVTGKSFLFVETIYNHPIPSQRTCTSQLLGTVILVVSMLTTAVSQIFVWMRKAKDLTNSVVMNLSHVITEFSFGPYFPDITQPLDNSFELTHERKLSTHNYQAQR